MTVKDGSLDTERKVLLTVPEAAVYLRCSERTLYERIRNGAYAECIRRESGRILFSRDALRRWISGEAS